MYVLGMVVLSVISSIGATGEHHSMIDGAVVIDVVQHCLIEFSWVFMTRAM